MKTLLVLLPSFLFVTLAQAKYSGGTGEPNDPYQIVTAEDLILLGETPEDYDKHFILTADIDLDPNLPGRKVFDKAVIAPNLNPHDSYPFNGTQFTGFFDGNGHTISRLTVAGGSSLGLFGQLGYGANVSNLALEAVAINGTGSGSGGLVGRNDEGSTITASYSAGEVSGNALIGGLVGTNRGCIDTSYSAGTVTGGQNVGGLVGWNNDEGDVIHCYSTDTVSGQERVGGLVGYNRGDIVYCHSTGAVSGTGSIGGLVGMNRGRGRIETSYSASVVDGSEAVGGLVGDGSGTIIYCYSTGEITGDKGVGGLIGSNYGEITSSYSSVELSGSQVVGGLVGYNGGSVTECYSIGAVKGTETVNGLVGSNNGDVNSCFWDTHTSGCATSDGGIGKNTFQMQVARTFLEVGWDFVDETDNGAADIWWILEGQDYPRLVHKITAYSPHPQDGAMDILLPVTLYWFFGESAVKHNIYFGEGMEAVKNATETSPEYKGRVDLLSESYAPENLVRGITYYWRIDEVNEIDPNSPWKGDVWSFTIADFTVLDNFENYTDLCEGLDCNRVYLTWIDGFGTADNGAIAGNLEAPFMSPGHNSAQAMPVSYDNAGKTSEATRTLTSKKDWTEHGVTKLVIWFSGASGNAAERMFVALGNAIVYHPDDAATQDGGWNEWVIDLQEFANQGANLSNVASITLGFGTRGAPVPTGGTGTVHFDDIRLIW